MKKKLQWKKKIMFMNMDMKVMMMKKQMEWKD